MLSCQDKKTKKVPMHVSKCLVGIPLFFTIYKSSLWTAFNFACKTTRVGTSLEYLPLQIKDLRSRSVWFLKTKWLSTLKITKKYLKVTHLTKYWLPLLSVTKGSFQKQVDNSQWYSKCSRDFSSLLQKVHKGVSTLSPKI